LICHQKCTIHLAQRLQTCDPKFNSIYDGIEDLIYDLYNFKRAYCLPVNIKKPK
jgi:hypothetical protein